MIDLSNKKVLVISDSHVGHTNIIKYCGRPVDCDERMLKAFEQRRDAEYVIHVGDFSTWYRVTDEQVRGWFDRMFAGVPATLIKGNHDRRKSPTMRLPWDRIVREHEQPWVIQCEGLTICFQHRPYEEKNKVGAHIQAHGHIHEKGQRFQWVGDPETGALNVNMCVEHWNYEPAWLTEIVREYYARQQYEREGHGRNRRWSNGTT